MKVNYLYVTPLLFLVDSALAIKPASVGECQTECNDNSHCMPGLECADGNEKRLASFGLDKRKAYCGPGKNKGHIERTKKMNVCFDPKKLGDPNYPNIPVPYTPPSPRIGLCQADCDLDIDCAPGLLCADEHTAELKAAGLHDRFANCPLSSVSNIPSAFEVCFDPKTISCKGGCGFGDPHFVTYDGTKYSYHGQCDLVMARSRGFAHGLGLDIHIRTEIVSDWSLISNAAVKIGEDTFELVNDGSYYINGVNDMNFPLQLVNEYNITKSIEHVSNITKRTHFAIQLDDKGTKIALTVFKNMISVRVDGVITESGGLLGVQGKAGMIARDGETVLIDPTRMGAEWQVRDNEPMLFHEARAPQYPTECVLPSVKSRRRLRKQDYNVAHEACANVSEDMYNLCVEDVMRTGDPEVSQGYGFGFAF
jgi:hypothetical protein